MMGTKIRSFASLPDDLSLEELVPKDNFYRRQEATLDLSFIKELVKDCYASSGCPSVDPVVFFRVQLGISLKDIRSERQLMEVAADRLSVRWFLGHDLNEPLPDHSSLTRIRERYGLQTFRFRMGLDRALSSHSETHRTAQTYSPREILNAVFYIVRSGCAWRLLPHDFPPWRIVYHYFRTWRLDGTWERMHTALRKHARESALEEIPSPAPGSSTARASRQPPGWVHKSEA